MRNSYRKGLSFGLTSGIITTLGLIIGLNSSTSSKTIIFSGILVIAIADAMSDAFGIHMSEESQNLRVKEIWEATISTFVFKFLFALSFIIPIYFFQLDLAVLISIFWGLSLISVFSYYIAKRERKDPVHIILEHIIIAIFVIVLTHLVGKLSLLVI